MVLRQEIYTNASASPPLHGGGGGGGMGSVSPGPGGREREREGRASSIGHAMQPRDSSPGERERGGGGWERASSGGRSSVGGGGGRSSVGGGGGKGGEEVEVEGRGEEERWEEGEERVRLVLALQVQFCPPTLAPYALSGTALRNTQY
eukprot:2975501-Rhodomonas_salina.2